MNNIEITKTSIIIWSFILVLSIINLYLDYKREGKFIKIDMDLFLRATNIFAFVFSILYLGICAFYYFIIL